MTFTKTPPTKPGAYWWRTECGFPMLREIQPSSDGDICIIGGECHGYNPEQIGGEWCGPLVPVEEVEKAYFEGAGLSGVTRYKNSRARRVAEGEI